MQAWSNSDVIKLQRTKCVNIYNGNASLVILKRESILLDDVWHCLWVVNKEINPKCLNTNVAYNMNIYSVLRTGQHFTSALLPQ